MIPIWSCGYTLNDEVNKLDLFYTGDLELARLA